MVDDRPIHFYDGPFFCGYEPGVDDGPLRVSVDGYRVTCPRCRANYQRANEERLSRLAWDRMLTKRQQEDRDSLRRRRLIAR